MASWKLIALDLDGTLLDLNGNVPAANREWIGRARRQGIGITLVTGRHVSKVMPFVQDLSLDVPFITSNGCEIWSPEGTLLQRVCMSEEQMEWIHTFAKSHRLLYRAYRVDGAYDWDPDAANEVDDTAGEWLKVLLKPKQSGFLPDVLYLEAKECGLFTVVGYKNDDDHGMMALDLHPLGVGKQTALQALCARLGIERENVMAFGDEINDIDMLRWAGCGVAMGNASRSVRLAADRLAPHHQQNGVAEVLREMLG